MNIRMLRVIAAVVSGISAADAGSIRLTLQWSGTTALVPPTSTVGGEPLTNNEFDLSRLSGGVAEGGAATASGRGLW